MSGLRSENKTLRSDLDLLKKTVDELLSQARPASTEVSTTALATTAPRVSSPVLKPNMTKDRSPFASSSWGPGGFGALPSLNVHTTFVPSPTANLFTLPLQPKVKNMNPNMNGFDRQTNGQHLPGNAEDESFFGSNPFLLNGQAIDRYRAQLYGKLTHNIQNQQQPVAGFRPSFFAPLQPKSPAASTSASSSYTQEQVDQDVMDVATRQTAYVASVAQNTLLSGLVKTFWKTFAGGNPFESSSTAADQVADLLNGKAELRIVPTRSSPSIASSSVSEVSRVDELSRGMVGLTVGGGSSCLSSSSSSALSCLFGRSTMGKATPKRE